MIILSFHLPLRESRSTPSFVVIVGKMARFASKWSYGAKGVIGATFKSLKRSSGSMELTKKISFGLDLRDFTFR